MEPAEQVILRRSAVIVVHNYGARIEHALAVLAAVVIVLGLMVILAAL